MISLQKYINEGKKWTKETCEEEARKYKTRNEFRKGNGSAYIIAWRNRWIDTYDWFEDGRKKFGERERKWTKETCENEAKKYKTRNQFHKNSPQAYVVSLKNGWINEYDWLEQIKKPKGYWNKETCEREAKKYKTRSEFQHNSSGAYEVAFNNNWIDDYDWLITPPPINKKWDKETCEREAKKYKTRSEFQHKNSPAYEAARRNGWLDDYDWFINGKDKLKKWDKESCEREAKKYKTRTEFANGCETAYNVARKNGWLDDYDWLKDERFDMYKDPIDMVYAYFFHDLNAVYVGRTLMRLQQDRDKAHIFDEKDAVVKFAKENNVPSPPMVTLEKDLTLEQGAKQEGYWVEHFKKEGWNILNRTKTGSIGGLGKGKWDKESCEREAKKYKSRTEFANGCGTAYNVARKNGWLDNYDWFVLCKKKNGYWNYETCAEEASKYKTRSEFKKSCDSAYKFAQKNGWLDDYDWFEKKIGKWNKDNCKEEARKYHIRSEFRNNCYQAYIVSLKNGWLDEFFPKKSITEYLYSRISIIQN